MDGKLSIGSVNGASFLQKIQETRPRKSAMAQAISSPNAFKMQLYFNALAFLVECMQVYMEYTERIIVACDRDMGFARF